MHRGGQRFAYFRVVKFAIDGHRRNLLAQGQEIKRLATKLRDTIVGVGVLVLRAKSIGLLVTDSLNRVFRGIVGRLGHALVLVVRASRVKLFEP